MILLDFLFHCRPLINEKLEEKDCGDGPKLEVIFEDDDQLKQLQHEIIV